MALGQPFEYARQRPHIPGLRSHTHAICNTGEFFKQAIATQSTHFEDIDITSLDVTTIDNMGRAIDRTTLNDLTFEVTLHFH